jgi:hypothetical protein
VSQSVGAADEKGSVSGLQSVQDAQIKRLDRLGDLDQRRTLVGHVVCSDPFRSKDLVK